VALAQAMHMSQFEAHACMARLSGARLLTEVNDAPALVMAAFRLLEMPQVNPIARNSGQISQSRKRPSNGDRGPRH
jgi:hypothetical protein